MNTLSNYQFLREDILPDPNRTNTPRPAVSILGVPLDNLTTTDALQAVERMIASGKPHYIATANVDFLVQARKDIELRSILLDSDLVLCDGTPLLWASRLLGNPLPERVAGADLTPLLIQLAERKRFRLFFLGASPEAASQAVTNLRRDHPDLVIAGHFSPPFSPLLEMDHEAITERIREARPDLLFVAFGCPKQEKWMAMHYRQLGVPVVIGIGATIDFLAGTVARAPHWMRRSGLEWVFRLAQEPRRLFRRYFTDLWVFGAAILSQWSRLHLVPRPRCPAESRIPFLVDPALQCVKLSGRLDKAAIQSYAELRSEISADRRHCLLDLADVGSIDSTGVSWLVRLQKSLRDAGGRLVLLSPSAAVTRTLRLMRLDPFFLIAADLSAARQLLARTEMEQSELVALPAEGSPDPLRWQGEITAANADEVWLRTSAHLAHADLSGVAYVDLSAVRFIDSSGLGLMIRAKKMADQRGTHLQFLGPTAPVRNVIRMARLDSLLLGGPKR